VTTDGGGSGTTSVAGQVRDPNGNPVELAFVKIEDTTSTNSTFSISPNGDFSMGDDPGTYTLTAQKAGFLLANAGTITIPAEGTAIHNIMMSADPAEDMDGDGVPDVYDPNLNSVDTDGDGLCDGPVSFTGICDAGEDWNANGAVDGTETDPNAPDTDGDGFTDGEEIAAGTDPLDPFSYPVTGIPGDVNGDLVVNTADVLICTRILMGLDTTTDWAPCDVAPLDGSGNPLGDSDINAGDIGVLQQMALGI
jgi:hypothetical protein